MTWFVIHIHCGMITKFKIIKHLLFIQLILSCVCEVRKLKIYAQQLSSI